MMKLKELKETDKDILKHLIENSNQTHKQISDKIGTTRQTISQRIRKLEKSKVINSYSIKIDLEQIEELQTKAYILFREDPDEKIRKKNEEKIKSMSEVTEFSRLFGLYDGLLKIIVQDNSALKELVKTLQNFDGIKETETFIIHTRVKDDEMAPILHLLEINDKVKS